MRPPSSDQCRDAADGKRHCHANSYGDGQSLLASILREGLGPVSTAITARREVDYRIATGLVGMFYCSLILVPPFGGAHNWRLSVIGAVVFGLVLYRQIDRLRFSKSRVEFVNPFGVVVASWPLDGTSRISFDEIVTQSRWGRAVRGSLVIKGGSGMALALTRADTRRNLSGVSSYWLRRTLVES